MPDSSTVVPLISVDLPSLARDSATAIGFPSARSLPDVENLDVRDAFAPGQTEVLYRIPIDAGESYLGLDLESTSTQDAAAEHLTVLDASGRVLFDSGTNSPSLVFAFVGSGPALRNPPPIFAEITPPGTLGIQAPTLAPQTLSFIFQVTRNPQLSAGPSESSGQAYVQTSFGSRDSSFDSRPSMPSSVLTGTTPTSTVPEAPFSRHETVGSPPSQTPLPYPATSPVPIAAPLHSPSPTGPTTEAQPFTVVTGALPLRSVAPLGGVLASGEPAPPVNRHETARADLVLSAAESEVTEASSPQKIVPYNGSIDGVAVSRLAVRGSGGFPLLMTAFLAETPANVSRLPIADAPGELTAAVTAETVASPPDGRNATVASSSRATRASRPGRETASKQPRRASALSGFALALVLTVGLMLPDLVATFQLTPATSVRLRFRRLLRSLGKAPA